MSSLLVLQKLLHSLLIPFGNAFLDGTQFCQGLAHALSHGFRLDVVGPLGLLLMNPTGVRKPELESLCQIVADGATLYEST